MKRTILLTLLLAIILSFSAVASNAAGRCAEPVPTEEGPVIGIEDEIIGVCSYRGIPYAAPPVGDLRWRAPEPAARRSGVLKAETFAPQCHQPKTGALSKLAGKAENSEDCLYLNIWKPDKPGKYPVMFWIHGGAFIMGSGSSGLYRGGRLVAREDVVVVTINYRLGPFGFLAHPELAEESSAGSSGNYGIFDQIKALEWVQKNIEAFGGDPQNVTIFGESAGAFSVCYLMASPLTKGLFNRAIMQSGSCSVPKTSEQDYETSSELAADLKCDPADSLTCLRSKSDEEIMKIVARQLRKKPISSGGMEFEWWPHVDGWLFAEQPIELLRKGDFNKVPLMIGSNRDEIKLFMLMMPKWMVRAPKFFVKMFAKKILGKDVWKAVEERYPPENYSKPIYAVADYIGDMSLGCPSFEVALAVSQFKPVYYYRFDYDDHNEPEKLGAAHGLEIPFVFDAFTISFLDLYSGEQIDRAAPLADAMTNYWANFARKSDPNGDIFPQWPTFDAENMQRMILDLPLRVETADNADNCEFHRDRPDAMFGEKK